MDKINWDCTYHDRDGKDYPAAIHFHVEHTDPVENFEMSVDDSHVAGQPLLYCVKCKDDYGAAVFREDAFRATNGTYWARRGSGGTEWKEVARDELKLDGGRWYRCNVLYPQANFDTAGRQHTPIPEVQYPKIPYVPMLINMTRAKSSRPKYIHLDAIRHASYVLRGPGVDKMPYYSENADEPK